MCLVAGCAAANADWTKHYVAGASLMEDAIEECTDPPCIDEAIVAACRHWERAEREAQGPYFREPLAALIAACYSLDVDLSWGIRLKWHSYVEDMTHAAEELSRRLNTQY